MRGKARKTRELCEFILSNVTDNPRDIGAITAQKFGISRQAVSRHLNSLLQDGLISATGKTRGRTYALNKIVGRTFPLNVTGDTAEHDIWVESIQPLLTGLKENILDICEYGFTEMVNNVISHSGSKYLCLSVERTALETTLTVLDTGIGVFKKIQNDFNLRDPRHALLELFKGKLTSDATSHSGEGIFFTSKMFDRFSIFSGSLFFSSSVPDDGGWLIETDREAKMKELNGTYVTMSILDRSKRDIKEVFDEYASEHANWGFTKTHIVLQLLRYEGEKLLSRSQAKRLLSRADQFKEVVLDFNSITYIGQAFADEIFRVFKLENPNVVICPINTTEDIQKMIARVSV